MKKKSNKTILIIVIAALAIGLYFYSQGSLNLGSLGVQADRGNNGWWNAEAQQCWTTPNNPQGGLKSFYSCCFDQNGYQVDCSDATKKLSSKPETFAVYFPSGGVSTPGIYSVSHSVTISNAKNTAFSKVWLEPVTWASSPTQTAGEAAVNTKWATMTGSSNAQAGALALGGQRAFLMTGVIDLQSLSPSQSTPVIYSAIISGKGTYLVDGVPTNYSASSQAVSFTVTKEEVGFSVAVNLNA